ncbi:MAG: anthranilate synthase component I [Planctomycetota bacterium]
MKTEYCPDRDTFRQKCQEGNVVPVFRQLMADTLTPVSAFQKICDSPYAFLLESVSGPEKIGRYCFLGSSPFALFKNKGKSIHIERGGEVREYSSDEPFEEFRSFLGQFELSHVDGLPRFSSGAVGYMGYDVVRFVEHLPNCPMDDRDLPDMYYMFFDEILIFDHLNKTIKVVCSVRTDEYSDVDEAYEQAQRRIDELIARLRTPVANLSDDISPQGEITLQWESNFEREDYLTGVEKCKEYIRAGDIFQVVPSQRLEVTTDASPLDIYRSLRVINPSPYMFYLKMDDLALVGSSPEVMVRVEDNEATVRPIAGTRRRGDTEEEDRELAEDLLADPKERAEHVMLVDLGRNDLGRVCEYGTVDADEIMVIERYSHVMHIVSNVTGELTEDNDALDALMACIPAGTLTGAPKVRAMEIIDELEPTRRGPYGGAVGYFDFSGNMDTCITIRTVVARHDKTWVQAGGGVVADSVPEKEFQETLNKAKALLRALEVAEMMGE